MTVNIEQFVGGRIRFAIMNALAGSGKPVTAYSIAIRYGLDPAATYRYLAEFAKVGIVESVRKAQKQTAYRLSEGVGKAAVNFLQYLKQEQRIDFDEWMRPKAVSDRAAKCLKARLSAGEVAELAKGEALGVEEAERLLEKRKSGELEALIEAGRIGFHRTFKQASRKRSLRYAMIE